MVDIHSHILNGVDDGAKDEQMSIDMLKTSVKAGVSKIVLTPHFVRGRYDVEFNDIKEEFNNLKAIAEANNIDIEMYLGQEVYYTSKMVEYYNEGFISTINNTRYMLIELPMQDFNLTEVLDQIYELRVKGIVPIIAHPERYIPFAKKPHLINKLIEEGCLFQLNARSILGGFGKEAKKLSTTYLEHNIYSFFGSDAHRSTGSRDTNITEFIEEIDNKTKRMFRANGNAMLADEEVEFKGNKIKEKKGFWIFGR